MKDKSPEVRLEQPGAYEKVFREGEDLLLTVRARWPRLAETAPGLRRIDRYYSALADRWIKRWEGPLLARARAADRQETPPWTATLDFTVTLLDGERFSLYLDAVEEVGRLRPRRVRQGDLWALPGGVPVTLGELLPPQRWWRGNVLAEIRRQIGRQVSAGEAIYLEDWPSLASRRFSPHRFYLTPEGPVVFYPVGAIAPALEGFPTFSLAGALSSGTETAVFRKCQVNFAKKL